TGARALQQDPFRRGPGAGGRRTAEHAVLRAAPPLHRAAAEGFPPTARAAPVARAADPAARAVPRAHPRTGPPARAAAPVLTSDRRSDASPKTDGLFRDPLRHERARHAPGSGLPRPERCL